MKDNSNQSNCCVEESLTHFVKQDVKFCSSTSAPDVEFVLVVDHCDEDLTDSLRSAVPKGCKVVSALEEYPGTNEAHFMPDIQQKEYGRKIIVLTSNRSDLINFNSLDCRVVSFTNSGIETQTKLNLLKRFLITSPFRRLSNLFDFEDIRIEKGGWVRYSRSGKQERERLFSPHPHSTKSLTLSIKL